MNKRLPLTVAGIVFFIVAFVHLLRLLYKWDVIVAGNSIPMSVSVIGFIIATALSLWMFIASRR